MGGGGSGPIFGISPQGERGLKDAKRGKWLLETETNEKSRGVSETKVSFARKKKKGKMGKTLQQTRPSLPKLRPKEWKLQKKLLAERPR